MASTTDPIAAVYAPPVRQPAKVAISLVVDPDVKEALDRSIKDFYERTGTKPSRSHIVNAVLRKHFTHYSSDTA